MIMQKKPVILKKEHLQQPRGNQIAERVKVSPVVGNVNPVAIKRIPVRRVNVKKQSPAQRKILPAKKNRPRNLVILKKEHLQQPKGNQIAERVKVSPVVGNVSPVAIKRIPVRQVNVKKQSPAQRKILPAKKEKNPVPIRKRIALRKRLRSNFLFLSPVVPFSVKP